MTWNTKAHVLVSACVLWFIVISQVLLLVHACVSVLGCEDGV